ncbi:MAG TPA: hypothetical protein VGP70_14960 [Actinomadura sp.]|jgi:hypothetical protein|nr:hypothetical protein [Actinomadura sp.]
MARTSAVQGSRPRPDGTVRFVGVTTDELHAAQSWNVEGLVTTLGPRLPMLITDLDRPSLAAEPDVLEGVREGARRDGSGTGYLFFDQLEAVGGDELRLTIGSKHVSQFTRVLPGRIPHGNALILTGGPALPVVLLPGPDFGHAHTDHALEVTLPGPACEELAHAITAEPGDYRVPALPGLTVTVVP